MSNLSNVWNEVKSLLKDGISIIPVRDKEEWKGDKLWMAKSPYPKWKRFQSEIISEDELWKQMESFDTTAVAIIAGRVSGNLEVIDLDVKHKAGSDATLFKDLQTFFPALFDKLRIHNTPSGGYHILYRVNGVPEGNQKLAGRTATDAELETKPKDKVKYFIETRGEGGYIVAPPSLNYTVHQDRPIPVLSWEERCAIISLCKSYHEIPAKVEKIEAPRKEVDYYDENPFDHFNNSIDAEYVLLEAGWNKHSESARFVYYSRPDGSNSVHASFERSKRLYYFWTTNSEFDSEKWYSAATVLAQLLYQGDKKKLYQDLVNRGFGKIKPKKEQELISNAAQYGGDLPKNLSQDALQDYHHKLANYKEVYPHGIFWEEDPKTKAISISREKLYNVSYDLGFRLHKESPVFIDGYIVRKVAERFYFDTLKQYIQEEDAELYERIQNAYEAFVQKSGTFTIGRLREIDLSQFLNSSRTESYKFYSNGIVKITADSVELMKYDTLNGKLVWEEFVHEREYNPGRHDMQNSLYYRYLEKCLEINDHVKQVIGYLAHDYKDADMGYIIVLVEMCENPSDGGGSGKNIFSTILEHITSYKNIPGSQVQFNEKFLQAWNFERIFSVSDLPKRFDFMFLKELSTGSGILKKLFKDEISVPVNEMPKLVLSTNYSYEVSDGGLKRRIVPVEFSDFFTRSGGVNNYFNAMFPMDWMESDWAGYDDFMIASIQAFLKAKCRLGRPELSEGGKLKQFDQMYGQLTREFIEENWDSWKARENVRIEDFNFAYDRFCIENNVNTKYKLSAQLMNRALSEWSKKHEVAFNPRHSTKENGITAKCKQFSDINKPKALTQGKLI